MKDEKIRLVTFRHTYNVSFSCRVLIISPVSQTIY